jgi:hypothetical protein
VTTRIAAWVIGFVSTFLLEVSTLKGVTKSSEKSDKNILYIYEDVSWLVGRIVVLDYSIARWEKKIIKLKKQHTDESEKRQTESKVAAFDQTIHNAFSAILASAAPTSAKNSS